MNTPYMPDPEQYLQAIEAAPQPKRPRRWKRIIAIVLVVLLVTVIGYGVRLASIVAAASSRPLSVRPMLTDGSGHTNMLVLGIGNPGHAGEKLSDTIMVLSVNHATGHVTYISIPRDLRVKLDGYGYTKINQANALGGAVLAQKTVEQVLGIQIEYVTTTDFSGLKDVVDAIGGIDVDVKAALVDPEYPCADDENRACGLRIEAGPQHMDGATALAYSRCRKGTCGNDFGRAARQQEVVHLITAKLTRPSILLHPVELAKVAQAIRANMSTDMSGLDLVQMMLAVEKGNQKADRLVLSTDTGGLLTGAYGSSDLLPVGGDYSLIQAKVGELLAR